MRFVGRATSSSTLMALTLCATITLVNSTTRTRSAVWARFRAIRAPDTAMGGAVFAPSSSVRTPLLSTGRVGGPASVRGGTGRRDATSPLPISAHEGGCTPTCGCVHTEEGTRWVVT